MKNLNYLAFEEMKSHENLENSLKNQKFGAFFEGKSWFGNQSKEFTCAPWGMAWKIKKMEEKLNGI